MADPVTPPKETVKPDVTPPPENPEDPKDDTLEGNDENLTISKIAFTEMQKTIVKLEKEAAESKAKETETKRLGVYAELLSLSPKLAKLNEKSSQERLEGALEAAKEQKGGFPSLKDDKKEPTKANESNHDTMDYDFVASAKEGKPVWVYT